MKFKSQYHKDAQELSESLDDARSDVADRRENLELIRRSSNGMAIMTEKEAEEANRQELVNHLLSYSKLLLLESMYRAMVTGTRSLIDCIVDTNNPEADLNLGHRISKILNDGLINHRGKFKTFWGKCAGEIVMAGGVPVCFEDEYGWMPKLRIDMIFPKDTELDPDDIPYAFSPLQLDLADLNEMVKEAEDRTSKSQVANIKNLRHLIDLLKSQPDERSNSTTSLGADITRSTRHEDEETSYTVLDCWEYWEVHIDEDTGDKYVNKTIFLDQAPVGPSTENARESSSDLDPHDGKEGPLILFHQEKVFESVNDWMTFVYVDTEIGGVKNTSTLRGVAELLFDSSQDLEDLLNLMIEGDKIRAKPKVQVTDDANVGQIAQYDIMRDLVAPKGLQEFQMGTSQSSLQTPMTILESSAASIAGAPLSASAGSGDLRVEALAKQQTTGNIQANRIGSAYDGLDSVLEMMVYRAMSADPAPGTEGYAEIKWCQAKFEEEGIDYKELSKRSYGRFKYIRVRAQRNLANGDRQSQMETSDWLMTNALQFAPAVRPIILKMAVQIRTQDPDLADYLVNVPEVVINQQKIVAENEFDTIRRRAVLGQAISIGVDDVHQDHIKIHLQDLQALLASHDIEPWTMLDVLAFSNLAEHVSEHIEVLLGNPETQNEVTPYLQDYQSLLGAARGVIQTVEEKSQGQEEQLSLKEELDFAFKQAELNLKARAQGVKEGDLLSLSNIRERRQQNSERQSIVRELTEARRLEQTDRQINQRSAQAGRSNQPDQENNEPTS